MVLKECKTNLSRFYIISYLKTEVLPLQIHNNIDQRPLKGIYSFKVISYKLWLCTAYMLNPLLPLSNKKDENNSHCDHKVPKARNNRKMLSQNKGYQVYLNIMYLAYWLLDYLVSIKAGSWQEYMRQKI